MPPKPLAAIIRSSDGVAERQRQGTYHGDEDQIADVERYCTARGLEYALLPPELDVSGGKPIEDRPSLLAAIEGVERGIYSGIVTANLKRLTRSRSGLTIWERVERAGGHVHTAAENIDTSTPNGRFMRDIFLADAVREREEHSERHARRRAATVEAGMWRMRQIPIGYQFTGPPVNGRYTGKARRLTPSDQADLVRQAARDVIAGASIASIAARIGMTPSGARAMLRNRVYLGELRDGPNLNANAHDPILDVDTFDDVQRALASNPRPARVHTEPALLAGLVRCAACGHIMTRGNSGGRRAYRCPANHSGARCPAPCDISLHILDEHVTAIALHELARIHLTAGAGDQAEHARAALATAKRELTAYVTAVSAVDIGEEAFAAGARQRHQAVNQARAQLDAAMATRTVMPTALDGDEAWHRLDVARRGRVLRGLLSAVIVRPSGRGRHVPVHDRARVIRYGAGLELPVRTSEKAVGLHPLPFPDLGSPDVLGPQVSSDVL